MLDIKTPLSKDTRVSRKFDATSSFTIKPGQWVVVANDGSVSNILVTPAGRPAITKLCISSVTGNQYESHDTAVGRITMLETIGARVAVDSDGFTTTTGTPAIGNQLAVDISETSKLGKLKVAVSTDQIVGVVEGYDSTAGILTYTLSTPSIKA